jgi:hypothetical protein
MTTPNPNPNPRQTYAAFGNFGSSMNPQVNDPFDVSNPLSYAVLPSFGQVFLHGGSGDSVLFNRVYAPNCMNFMAEYAALHGGDPFVLTYMRVNLDTYWPNMAVIDRESMTTCYNAFTVRPTLGEMMMHNACERRFLDFPSVPYYYEPFDPTTANSPMVRFYSQRGTVGKALFKNLDKKKDDIDQDYWIQQMIDNPEPVLDVWVRIWLAVQKKELDIKGTIIEPFLHYKSNKLELLYGMLESSQGGQYDIPQYIVTPKQWFCEPGATPSHCRLTIP